MTDLTKPELESMYIYAIARIDKEPEPIPVELFQSLGWVCYQLAKLGEEKE